MVDDNFETRTLSSMSDLSPPAEGYGNQVKGTCRRKDDRWKKDLSDRDVNAELVQGTTWTNEKHNMYLNVLEASFVQQLHNSFSFAEKTFDLQHVNKRDSSDQLSVLRKGSWKKISLKKDQPLLCGTVGSPHESKIGSRWLYTPRFPLRCDWKINPNIQENFSERTPSRMKRRGFSHNLASSESQCSFNHSNMNELCIEPEHGESLPFVIMAVHPKCWFPAEGTDQNFVDELVEKPIRKKIKREDASPKMRVSTQVVVVQPETSTVCKASEE